jgi:hypothetical protein
VALAHQGGPVVVVARPLPAKTISATYHIKVRMAPTVRIRIVVVAPMHQIRVAHSAEKQKPPKSGEGHLGVPSLRGPTFRAATRGRSPLPRRWRYREVAARLCIDRRQLVD